MDAISSYGDLAESYLRLGQPVRALDYVEQMTQITGPYILRVFEGDPLFASLKSNPQWSELVE